MAASKTFCSFFLVISSMVFVGFAQQSGGGGGTPGTPGSPGTSLPCVQKLLPCQPYLKQPSNPPSTCCLPLKQLVVQDPQCLCQVFNNPVLLKSLNITQHDALQLAKSCKANADVSICKSGGPPTSPPATPTTPPTSNSPSTSNSTTSSPPKSAAVGVGSPFGVSAALACLLSLVLSNMGSI